MHRQAWKHSNFVHNSTAISQKSISMSDLDSILQIQMKNKAYYLKTKLLSIKS